MNMRAPAPLSAEYHELHAELERAAKAGGMTAVAAKEVTRLFHDLFVKEDEFALPPLALLKQLAKGEDASSMADARKLTDRLEAELPNLLAEHFVIVQALNRLADAADSEGLPEQMRFADKMIAHVRMKEDVLYPAAILVGLYLKTTAPHAG